MHRCAKRGKGLCGCRRKDGYIGPHVLGAPTTGNPGSTQPYAHATPLWCEDGER